MKVLIELDLETKECQLLSIKILSPKVMISMICGYLGVSYEELIDTPLPAGEEYVTARKLITYFLINKGVDRFRIMKLLNYAGVDNVDYIYKAAYNAIHETKNEKIIRPFNNINRLLEDYNKPVNV
jgi:hypothetical protein